MSACIFPRETGIKEGMFVPLDSLYLALPTQPTLDCAGLIVVIANKSTSGHVEDHLILGRVWTGADLGPFLFLPAFPKKRVFLNLESILQLLSKFLTEFKVSTQTLEM